jgi:hypothetical protein
VDVMAAVDRTQHSLLVRIGKSLGLYLSPAAWFTYQQLIVAQTYAACSDATPRFAIAMGALFFCIAALGLAASVHAIRTLSAELGQDTFKTDLFLARLSLFVAAISMLGIAYSTAAAFFLQCER